MDLKCSIYIYIYRNRFLKIIANIHKYILYTYIPGSWHRHPSHGVPCLQAIAEQEVLVRFPMETPVCWWTWTWLAMGLQEVHRGSSGRDRVSSVPLASLSSSSFEAWCLPHLGSPAWLLHSAQCLDFYLNGEGKTEKNVCCWLPYLVISSFQHKAIPTTTTFISVVLVRLRPLFVWDTRSQHCWWQCWCDLKTSSSPPCLEVADILNASWLTADDLDIMHFANVWRPRAGNCGRCWNLVLGPASR